MSKIADVGIPETPAPLASANVGNGRHPFPPKTCRRLKWMVPYHEFCVTTMKIVLCTTYLFTKSMPRFKSIFEMSFISHRLRATM